MQKTSDFLYKLLLAIGIVVMFIVGTILGIKFMVASAEDKAKVKEALVPYVIGCVVIFGAFTIWETVVNIGTDVFEWGDVAYSITNYDIFTGRIVFFVDEDKINKQCIFRIGVDAVGDITSWINNFPYAYLGSGVDLEQVWVGVYIKGHPFDGQAFHYNTYKDSKMYKELMRLFLEYENAEHKIINSVSEQDIANMTITFGYYNEENKRYEGERYIMCDLNEEKLLKEIEKATEKESESKNSVIIEILVGDYRIGVLSATEFKRGYYSLVMNAVRKYGSSIEGTPVEKNPIEEKPIVDKIDATVSIHNNHELVLECDKGCSKNFAYRASETELSLNEVMAEFDEYYNELSEECKSYCWITAHVVGYPAQDYEYLEFLESDYYEEIVEIFDTY